MSNLKIETVNEMLVVDSRLISEELEIQHESFMRTLKTYESAISELGVFRFEIGEPSKSTNGGRPGVFCYLNEEQATFAMTLSRNTESVVKCKLELVKKFSEAKKQLIRPKSALELAREQVKLLEHIEYLESQKNQLEQENTKLDKINNILVEKIEEDQPKVEFYAIR